MPAKTHCILAATILAMVAGCEEDDPRVARIAQQAAERQAHQNEAMADLQKQTAEATKELINEQAAAREAADAERHQLNEGWDALESERREIAKDRRTVSFLVAASRGAWAVLLALSAVAALWILTGAAQAPRRDAPGQSGPILPSPLPADRLSAEKADQPTLSDQTAETT